MTGVDTTVTGLGWEAITAQMPAWLSQLNWSKLVSVQVLDCGNRRSILE